MTSRQLKLFRTLGILFSGLGFGGLMFSSGIASNYEKTLPKAPAPEEMRMVPRNIQGTVVYQTDAEDRRLTRWENSSVTFFLIGVGFGLLYFGKRGMTQAIAGEEDSLRD